MNNWKHCWQEDFIEEKESSKVSYLLFVSIVMKLVILFQCVHRRRITKKEKSTRTREKKIKKTIKKKVRDATLLKMIIMRMIMK